MWLAVVFYCVSPSNVDTCAVTANVNNIFYAEEECIEDAKGMAGYLVTQGLYARYACFKVGTGA
jgi:hypothetical protein